MRCSGVQAVLVGLGVMLGAFSLPAIEPYDQLVERAEGAEGSVIEGEDGWLFLTEEVARYGEASRDPALVDEAVETVKEFHRMLADQGIDLLVVPVPGKVVLYPDKLGDLEPDALASRAHARFVSRLKEAGVEVVDLEPRFRALRAGGGDSHLQEDSHWSPEGLQEAVAEIAGSIRSRPWAADAAGTADRQREEITVQGDLAQLSESDGAGQTIAIDRVEAASDRVLDPASPLVLIGDSHTLVYGEPIPGGLATRGAGLAEQLFAETGLGLDRVANQGSGVNAPRARLARRSGDEANLAGKRMVIWVFAERDLIGHPGGWARIPVIRD